MAESPSEPPFPRGKAPPDQSPRFWVHHKDRYLRQLLIRDIEEQTGRDFITYFTDCDTVAQIDHNNDSYSVELLGDRIYCEGRLFLNAWTGKDGQQRTGLSRRGR